MIRNTTTVDLAKICTRSLVDPINNRTVPRLRGDFAYKVFTTLNACFNLDNKEAVLQTQPVSYTRNYE